MYRPAGIRPFSRSIEQDGVLDRILAVADAAPERAVGVFDLDGTVFDTRPRIVHLLRELAGRQGFWDLYRIQTHHLRDWDLRRSMARAGIADDRAAAMEPTVRQWFMQKFFDGDYVLHDHAFPGASAMVWACYRAGLQIVYLTGRHEEMRRGTERALLRSGFPYERPGTHLVVKPDMATDDTEFKDEALREVQTWGPPVLFVDNEPSNVNLFHERHPEALTVFFESDHSPLPVRPDPALPRIQGWLRHDATWALDLDEQGRRLPGASAAAGDQSTE
jgi:hypothetical protein